MIRVVLCVHMQGRKKQEESYTIRVRNRGNTHVFAIIEGAFFKEMGGYTKFFLNILGEIYF